MVKHLAICVIVLFLPAISNVAWSAPVSWVPDADGLWQTPVNWSSNPSLPGPADDVTIDRPAAITVTISSGNPSVRSLTSMENLIVGGGTPLTLTVGEGGGQINGALTITPGAKLTSSGGMLQAGGTIMADRANLDAQSGGTLNLAALSSYTAGNGTTMIRANGTGSSVNLSGVTSLSGGTGFATTQVYAQAGGTVNLSGLPSITAGAVDVIATGAGSTIDFGSLATFSPNNPSSTRRFRAENGGTLQIKTAGNTSAI